MAKRTGLSTHYTMKLPAHHFCAGVNARGRLELTNLAL